jgi:hypothetical protein
MKKRLLAILLTLCMVAALLPTAALAGDDATVSRWDGTTPNSVTFEGSGTSDSPYLIKSASDLAFLAKSVNEGNTYESKYFKLTADIDLAGKEWTPIGSSTAFQGIFDGCTSETDGVCSGTHTISNLYINRQDQNNVGLFGQVTGKGVVKNLTIENVDVTGCKCVAALVGNKNTSQITNCHVKGNIVITGNYDVGGISGYGYGSVTNCSVVGNDKSTSKITGVYSGNNIEGDNVGGLIGYRAEEECTTTGCKVQNVTLTGTRKVGGLLGTGYTRNKITDCTVDNVDVVCTASKEYATSSGNQGKLGIGGLIGQLVFKYQNQGCITNSTLSNVTITFNTDDDAEVKKYMSVGLVSGGLRNDEPADGTQQNDLIAPTAERMTIDVKITGTNSLPDGIKEFSGVGQIEAIGLPVAKVGDISYNTLEAAIAAANDGDTVEIMEGTYDYTDKVLDINKAVNLKGAGADKTIITGRVQYSYQYNNPNWVGVVNDTTVTVEDLTIQLDLEKNINWGFSFCANSNSTLNIKNCAFEGWQFAINFWNNTGCTLNVTNTKFTNVLCGVAFGSDNNNTISGFGVTEDSSVIYAIQDYGYATGKLVNLYYDTYASYQSGTVTMNRGTDDTKPAWPAEARIGGMYYTLEKAIENAADGDTIELLTDISDFTGITYDGGKNITLDLNDKTVKMSGTNAFLNVTAGTVAVTGDGTVTGSAESILSASGTGKIEVESGTFSSDVTKYCAEGLVANKNAGENTWTVGELADNTVVEDIADTVKNTAKEETGATVGSVAATVTNQAAALEVAKSVTVKDNNDAIGYVKVTDAEVTEALLKLKAAGAIELNNDGTLANGSEISVTYKVYMVAEATAYDATNKTAELNIEPKYDIIVSGKKGNADGSEVTVVSGRSTTVEGNVEVSVKLSSEFVGNATTAYITHEHGDATYLYKGTIANDKLTFVNPYGFSKFKVSLKAPYKNWINRTEDMEKFDSLQEAVEDVQNGETIYLADETSDTIYVGRTVTFTLDGPFEGQVVASNIYTTVNKTGSGDKITYTCVYTAPSVPVYRVVVNDAEGGKIKASANKAAEGATIVLTPIADDEEGELETLAVVDEDGNAVTLTKRANGTYSFVMPAKAVTVTGTFTIVADPEEPDEDEEPGDEEEETVFTDVDEDAYYAEAVAWAVANEITKGTSETTFSPDDDCTRAQVVTFLWRYAGKPEPTTAENPFTDVEEGTDYYKAILWAYENGITTGTSETTFSPDETCTRAQVVTFLWRYEGELTYEEAETFTDVAEDAYYAKAVAWAVHEWITNGTGDGQFSPDDTCTRGQVVTFLYRDTAEG